MEEQRQDTSQIKFVLYSWPLKQLLGKFNWDISLIADEYK